MLQISPNTATPQLLRRPVVEQMTGLSRSSLYRLMAIGQFVQPVRISERAVAWRAEEILAWIESRAKRGV